MANERDQFDVLVDRLRTLIEPTGKSERQISIEATGQPDALRNIRMRRGMPSAPRLQKIAEVLHTTPAYLLGVIDDPDRDADGFRRPAPSPAFIDEPLPKRVDMPQTIPVYGTALGSLATQEFVDGDATAIEQTDLNTGEIIDYFRRPPALSQKGKVYGLYVAGSSMEPAFESGQVVLVDPTRPAAIRDNVVVYLRDSNDEGGERASAVLIKRLVKRSGTFLELEQYNPYSTFRVPMDRISQVHRIITMAEILGV